MAQLVEHLPCMHEDLTLDSKHSSLKKLIVIAYAFNPSSQGGVGQSQEGLVAC